MNTKTSRTRRAMWDKIGEGEKGWKAGFEDGVALTVAALSPRRDKEDFEVPSAGWVITFAMDLGLDPVRVVQRSVAMQRGLKR